MALNVAPPNIASCVLEHWVMATLALYKIYPDREKTNESTEHLHPTTRSNQPFLIQNDNAIHSNYEGIDNSM
jgi:hypothetical protein